jgi:hypothetical protein
MQIALAVGAAVDHGPDVIAGPGSAGTELAAGTELVMQPALFRRVAIASDNHNSHYGPARAAAVAGSGLNS